METQLHGMERDESVRLKKVEGEFRESLKV
jgi:hypothetical protein